MSARARARAHGTITRTKKLPRTLADTGENFWRLYVRQTEQFRESIGRLVMRTTFEQFAVLIREGRDGLSIDSNVNRNVEGKILVGVGVVDVHDVPYLRAPDVLMCPK